jgi:heme-degrading monooxygenase HmoA
VFVRVGSFRLKPGTLDEFRETYYSTCSPIVKAASGSVDCMVLEPTDEQDPIAVCTVWQTEADAVAYEASGVAADVVSRVRAFFAGPPELHSYRIQQPYRACLASIHLAGNRETFGASSS